MDKKEMMAAAYHEAGHAVAAWFYAVRFSYVQVMEDGCKKGEIVYNEQNFGSKAAKTRTINRDAHVSAAGPLAESFYYNLIGKPHFEASLWSQSDYEGLADFKGGPDSYCAETHPVTWAVKDMIGRDDIQATISVVAGALFAKGRLDASEVADIAKRIIPKKGYVPLAQHDIRNQIAFAAVGRRVAAESTGKMN
ncbi:hypothetical protein OEG84_19590 [Hoeflea sp. G2-23]|uniref:Peptidase M41 domain-containing protein n=1 Tax=Hoeflea algicola TaxID=2983763 RepID=A0ABT3ZDG6_9HYPH|nr:hypothetical protein [Hoeflea algicola]MCY0149842.1 hypothetical protein [Hoeflea algicola]